MQDGGRAITYLPKRRCSRGLRGALAGEGGGKRRQRAAGSGGLFPGRSLWWDIRSGIAVEMKCR